MISISSRDISGLKPNAKTGICFSAFFPADHGPDICNYFFADDNVLIQQWSYLSLGLRGSTICFPLLSVIFLKNKISPLAGTLAVLLSPASVIIGTVLRLKLNPLYIGLAVGLGILFWGFLFNPETKDKTGYISKT